MLKRLRLSTIMASQNHGCRSVSSTFDHFGQSMSTTPMILSGTATSWNHSLTAGWAKKQYTRKRKTKRSWYGFAAGWRSRLLSIKGKTSLFKMYCHLFHFLRQWPASPVTGTWDYILSICIIAVRLFFSFFGWRRIVLLIFPLGGFCLIF